jgi:Aminoglycoside phosphotransferase
MNISGLPDIIRAHVGGRALVSDTVGESGSRVFAVGDDMFLKIDGSDSNVKDEAVMMAWLHGKLPVPEVIETHDDGENFYLLMSKVDGEMACSEIKLSDPEGAVRLLAEGIRMFQKIPTAGCPRVRDVDAMLKSALKNIESGDMDDHDWSWDLTADLDLTTTAAVYDYLVKNAPRDEELVLAHGDFCLPNVMLKDGRVEAFIDLGYSGISDKWYDIMQCRWSIRYNLRLKEGIFTHEYDALFFDSLGVTPDEEKLKYYEILSTLT